MPPLAPSKSVGQLDCPERMFLTTLCLTDADLETLRVLPEGPECCVSRDTAARTVLHRLCALEPGLSRGVTDLLDLRHASVVTHVRSCESAELAPVARSRGIASTGEELAGWAWALLTDPREEVTALGRRLMGECYVRGMRGLAASPTTGT